MLYALVPYSGKLELAEVSGYSPGAIQYIAEPGSKARCEGLTCTCFQYNCASCLGCHGLLWLSVHLRKKGDNVYLAGSDDEIFISLRKVCIKSLIVHGIEHGMELFCIQK